MRTIEALRHAIRFALAISLGTASSAPSWAQASTAAALRQTMAARAEMCAAAILIDEGRRGEARIGGPSGRYTTLAMMLAPGRVTTSTIVRSLDREGMSSARVARMAEFCNRQLSEGKLEFSLDAVAGFPANDLLRARLCAAALEAGVGLFDATIDAALIRDVARLRGSLNLYAGERARALGVEARPEPFRSPTTGGPTPTEAELLGCIGAGESALVLIADPWSATAE